jgi:hypothetical protein
VLCERCDGAIDSDDDPGCFCSDPWGGNEQIICEPCRERAYDAHQESLMEGGGGPSLLEQQQAAYKIKHGLR